MNVQIKKKKKKKKEKKMLRICLLHFILFLAHLYMYIYIYLLLHFNSLFKSIPYNNYHVMKMYNFIQKFLAFLLNEDELYPLWLF